jgi:hypothetical protein
MYIHKFMHIWPGHTYISVFSLACIHDHLIIVLPKVELILLVQSAWPAAPRLIWILRFRSFFGLGRRSSRPLLTLGIPAPLHKHRRRRVGG